MMRFIMPIVLIGISISVFFLFTNNIYTDLAALKAQAASYNAALENSNTLGKERDKLVEKKNAMNNDDVARLNKLLPENVDNIRLILEIQQIAAPYGIDLKDVKYSVADKKTAENAGGTVVSRGGVTSATPKDYGIFDLEFSVSGIYSNFISFTKDLETNLRIVDISSIDFSSNTAAVAGTNTKTNSSEIYKYNFKIKTYWLKN